MSPAPRIATRLPSSEAVVWWSHRRWLCAVANRVEVAVVRQQDRHRPFGGRPPVGAAGVRQRHAGRQATDPLIETGVEGLQQPQLRERAHEGDLWLDLRHTGHHHRRPLLLLGRGRLSRVIADRHGGQANRPAPRTPSSPGTRTPKGKSRFTGSLPSGEPARRRESRQRRRRAAGSRTRTRVSGLEARQGPKVRTSRRRIVANSLERHVDQGAVVGLQRDAQIELDRRRRERTTAQSSPPGSTLPRSRSPSKVPPTMGNVIRGAARARRRGSAWAPCVRPRGS